MKLRTIVLAAGQGTRMKSAVPKVLHELAGRPMLSWVLGAVEELGPDEVMVVVGAGADLVEAAVPAGVHTVHQERRLGTGHAAAVAVEALDDRDGTVLVLPGDAPLITGDTLRAAVEHHQRTGAAATLLTTLLDEPAGYGRVLRDGNGHVAAIVEERDADEDQRAIQEVAISMYVFDTRLLEKMLARLEADNAQEEHYLTDVIGFLVDDGLLVEALSIDPAEAMGINTHGHLAEAAAEVRRRINAAWMQEGVWMLDPERVYLDASVRLAPGARLYPDVHLEGDTEVAGDAVVGPGVYLQDTSIGSGARVWYSVLRNAEVGPGAEVGPYASLRPGTVLAEQSKAGTFVEMKNSRVGKRSKVPHLSYMGDATLGEDTNIGAGTITCNYDGSAKHPTTVGDRVFIGSDTMLVAPVEVGDDAWTGAGSVITEDIPPGALGVARSTQRNVPDYAARRRKKRQGQTQEEP